MRTLLLFLLITLSEATIGVFVKLTVGLIPLRRADTDTGQV